LFFGFFSKDIKFIVKIFWPYHSNPKGFSIKNFAEKHGGKILSFSSSKNSNQFSGNSNLKSIKRDSSKQITTSNLAAKTMHWANRDFSEYREAA
tara:strand:- start:1289 stop:1570 length:282 start_codon:yes stop_codon:yes gene_type:complete